MMNMSSRRMEKVNSLLRDLIASYFSKESLSGLLAITRVQTSKDLKLAKIFITIFPEGKEKEGLTFLNEKKEDLRKFIGSKIKMKFLPRLEFEIDKSEKARQKIEEILEGRR